ncbi:MAG: hypothetical protein IPL61_36610 [Myxococcales bacterium]|nr:hypothetical protein [Myxococcales bacterium]
MGEWKRWTPPVVAALGLLIGLLVVDWVVTDVGLGSLHLGPRSSQLCAGSHCVDVRSGARTWNLMSGIALAVGVLSAVGLIIVAALRFLGTDPGPFGRATAWACAATTVFALVALVAAAPDAIGDYAAGGPLTVIAATFGISVRTSRDSASAFGSGRSARPVRSVATVVASHGGAASAVTSVPPRATAAASASSAGAPTAARSLVGAGVSHTGVRFVVVDGALTATGLALRFERSVERTIVWADLVEAVARRLPPDPPHDKATFIDLVVADGAPARLTPASRVDFTALPDGQAANTRENWRRLVALARTHNPAIAIEAESADFFAGGRDAPMFTAWKKFLEWDQRYGA